MDPITGRLLMTTVRKMEDSGEDGTEKERNEHWKTVN